MTDPMALTPEFILEPLPIHQLRLDARYQRDLDETVVQKIVSNYRPELFQPVIVGMRDDSTLHIVDGQHRYAAARRMAWKEVPCMVFESRGFEHEAEIFELMQTERQGLSVAQRWKARLARGEEVAVRATEIVESMGLRLSSTVGPVNLCCHRAVEQAYERGNLRDTLVLIVQAWEYDVTGFRSTFINAVSVFLGALSAEHFEVDLARISIALGKVRPSAFLRETALFNNVNAAFMSRVLDAYNKGLRTGKIEVADPATLILRARGLRSVAKRPDAASSMHQHVAAMTPEQRSAKSRAGAASMTPEQRRERAMLSAQTKKRNAVYVEAVDW